METAWEWSELLASPCSPAIMDARAGCALQAPVGVDVDGASIFVANVPYSWLPDARFRRRSGSGGIRTHGQGLKRHPTCGLTDMAHPDAISTVWSPVACAQLVDDRRKVKGASAPSTYTGGRESQVELVTRRQYLPVCWKRTVPLQLCCWHDHPPCHQGGEQDRNCAGPSRRTSYGAIRLRQR